MFRQLALSTAAITALIVGLSSVGETDLSSAAPNAAASSYTSAPAELATQPSDPSNSAARGKMALDRSGERRVGKASFYAERYVGRKMADGTRMRRDGDNAASLTLPLGTVAKVTNLSTGRTEVVTIQDRGPYVSGRIIDLSPGTAQRLGIDRRQGLAKVSVAPISVPLADGSIKAGVAANGGHELRVSSARAQTGRTFEE